MHTLPTNPTNKLAANFMSSLYGVKLTMKVYGR